MWVREHVLVVETLPELSHQQALGRDAEPMGEPERVSADQGRNRNPKDRLPEDLRGSALGASDLFYGTILQLVLGKGLVYQEV